MFHVIEVRISPVAYDIECNMAMGSPSSFGVLSIPLIDLVPCCLPGCCFWVSEKTEPERHSGSKEWLIAGAALRGGSTSIWGFEGIKDQAPVLPRHVECHFFPERVRHLSPRYFSHKLLHSSCFVTDRLRFLGKQFILPLVSEMCFPVLKHWFLSIYFGSFLKVEGAIMRVLCSVRPNKK